MILGVSDPDGGTEGDITTNYEARAIELYAVNDIPDLSKYGIGAANNGGGTDGVEYTLPAVAVSKGTFILLGRDSTNFRNYYGIDYDYNGGGSALGFNGDDAIELFYSGIAIDVFGDINVDGSGQAWDYAQHLILTVGTIAVKMLTMILLQMQHHQIHTLLNHIKITNKTL